MMWPELVSMQWHARTTNHDLRVFIEHRPVMRSAHQGDSVWHGISCRCAPCAAKHVWKLYRTSLA